jgi:tetratricopeptide (TPR) repeat protein
MVQQALEFSQQENYPRLAATCLTHMGRAYRRKGDYSAARKALEQKLELAKQSNSQPAIADSHIELGALLLEQEQLPAALEQYDNAIKIYGSTNDFLVAFCNANRAQILTRLGRYDEAQQLLDELFKVAKSKNAYLGLVPELHLVDAEMSLSKGNLSEATRASSESIKLGGPNSDVAIQAQYISALSRAVSGGRNEASKLCDQSIKAASSAGDFGLQSRALLACAEVALKGNDAQTASTLATQAQDRFGRGEQFESEWRAWVIASRASQRLGDTNRAEEQMRNAVNARSRLEQKWGPDAFKRYALRPDIQVYIQ